MSINCKTSNTKSIMKNSEEVNNIFEEIEELLNGSESLEKSTRGATFQPLNALSENIESMTTTNNRGKARHDNDPAVLNTQATDKEMSLNFLQTHVNYDFLISTDTDTAPEEELSLYSVNQNELQPVNAPFMVPGIYKKITNASLAASKPSQNYVPDLTNVILTTKCPNGRIISRVDFESRSAKEQATENKLNTVEDHNLTKTKSRNVDTPSNTLLTFAYNIHKSAKADCIVIDRDKNEITRIQPRSNDQILYRFLRPEDLNLQNKQNIANSIPAKSVSHPAKTKIGRPRKHLLANENKPHPGDSSKQLKIESNTKQQESTTTATNFQHPFTRTRSGRMVKLLAPPLRDADVKQDSTFEADNVENIINESKDKDFQCNVRTPTTTEEVNFIEPVMATDASTNHRRVPPNAICPKCGKIFLGRRLNRHFTQHPDHMLAKGVEDTLKQKLDVQIATDNTTEDMTLFRYLITKLQKPLLNEDQRVDLFLNELNDLVEQLQLRSTRLIRNTSGLHFVSARTARLLGIPEGQYALDLSAIDSDAPFIDPEHNGMSGEERKPHQIIPPVVAVNTPSLDYTAISLDDTLTDEAAQKLNLSAGGKLLPPSEESLLRAVGDLVHDGITKLVDANLLHPPRSDVQSTVTSTLVQQYDHVSDNAVEALTIKENNAPQEGTSLLDLNVDFFQFKNN